MRESSPPTEATLPPAPPVMQAIPVLRADAGARAIVERRHGRIDFISEPGVRTEFFVELPAVCMTAKVQAAEAAYYKSLGAIGVLAKPFDPMQLAAQVRGLWEREE